MSRALLALSATLVMMPIAQAGPLRLDGIAEVALSAVTLHKVHGCHQKWAHGLQGWHRHGPGCESHKGLVDRSKPQGKAKKTAT